MSHAARGSVLRACSCHAACRPLEEHPRPGAAPAPFLPHLQFLPNYNANQHPQPCYRASDLNFLEVLRILKY